MRLTIVISCLLSAWVAPAVLAQGALSSWNDTGARQSIIGFVQKVTTQGSPAFLPERERIAVFDNDGTLWAEQPMYFQFFFAMDRVKVLAPKHPEWQTTEPFASLLRAISKKSA
jgi:hypothetical protein